MKRKRSALLVACLFWNVAQAAQDSSGNSSEADYFQEFPVVLSASRLSQPLSETPNAMTVIDRKMIDASGFRTIPDLFKLVPGMYVSYSTGSQAIVSYHGTTDFNARRMQVMIDGRSIYMPPANAVDWASLPITMDDIERVEVIRGPAAASYGANSTQGVINIITRDAGALDGANLSYTHGNKGINDASVRAGSRGETFDHRLTLAYTADNGYDPGVPPAPGLINVNDSNLARLMNYRANYHPNGVDSFDMQAGYNHDVRGVGSDHRTPTPANPVVTNGNPPHDLHSSSGFVDLGWVRALENSSDLSLRYHHTEENQHEALPVYLSGIYFPGPVTEVVKTQRDAVEAQHTLQLTGANRLVYGAAYQVDRVSGVNNMPPVALVYSASLAQSSYRVFAHDEWRIAPSLLLNAGAMYERDRMGHKGLSPRVSLNYHFTPKQTLRAGVSVANRTPALAEERYPPAQPGSLVVPFAAVTSPGLGPEKITSREIGYLGEFPEWGTSLDIRLFSDLLQGGIYLGFGRAPGQYAFVNELNAEYRGVEATIKQSWNGDNDLTLNLAHEMATSNAPGLVVAGNLFVASKTPGFNDVLAASTPKNSASLLYSRRLPDDYSFSTAYYYQDSLQPFDRGPADFQPIQRRLDARIAKSFHAYGGIKGNVALVMQNVLNHGYTEYNSANLFNRRAYVKLDLAW